MSFIMGKLALLALRNSSRRIFSAHKSSPGVFTDFRGLRKYCSCEESKKSKSSKKSKKSALIILADEAEEMETAIIVDVLRRTGIKVTVAGLCDDDPVKCMNGLVIKPDISLEDAVDEKKYDAIIIPGGNAVQDLMDSDCVGHVLQEQEADGRIVAAICGGPLVLQAHDIGVGKSITAYPLVLEQLEDSYKIVKNINVVQDGNIITSRGPITCFHFAFKIAECLLGPEKACEVAKELLLA